MNPLALFGGGKEKKEMAHMRQVERALHARIQELEDAADESTARIGELEFEAAEGPSPASSVADVSSLTSTSLAATELAILPRRRSGEGKEVRELRARVSDLEASTAAAVSAASNMSFQLDGLSRQVAIQ